MNAPIINPIQISEPIARPDFHTIDVPESMAPRLIVVVDTEAEFDWNEVPDASANQVEAVQNIHLVQKIFDQYGITPCYVLDYPIATQKESVDIFRHIIGSHSCEIGAHLHPWVNPPLVESDRPSDTFPGNLGYDLEHAKLARLTTTIGEQFGLMPRSYKAGRYGIGPHTPRILRELGYEIDLSVCPPFDYSGEGGPDFSQSTAKPCWIGEDQSLLEIPLSGAFVGAAGQSSASVYQIAGHFPKLRLRGALSKLNIVDRLLLSPEGHCFDEHKKLVRFLLTRGIRTFTWSFHSPTLLPGMTIYTQSERDLHQFLDRFRRFFDFFFEEIGGIATTPQKLRQTLTALPRDTSTM